MASKNMKKLKRRILSNQSEVYKASLAEQHPRNFIKLFHPDEWKDPTNQFSMRHCEIPRKLIV